MKAEWKKLLPTHSLVQIKFCNAEKMEDVPIVSTYFVDEADEIARYHCLTWDDKSHKYPWLHGLYRTC